VARRLGWFAVAALVAVSMVPATLAASGDKVTICHATDSEGNPYVTHEPSKSGDVSGHADHTGPVWYPGAKDAGVVWGDIIPPFEYGEGESFPGLNWTDEGQAFYNNGCNIPGSTTAPPTTAPPTEAPTTAPPTEAPTTAPPTEAPTTAPPTEAPTTAPPTVAPTTAPPTVAPTGGVLPTEAVPTEAPTQAPTGAVGGATATPGTTLPPTDTLGDSAAATGSDGWRVILLALAATLAAALLLTPARVVRKDR